MQAPTYTRSTNFAQDERDNVGGRSTVQTADVDAELDAISSSVNALRSNQSLNQRDDGEIRDARVKLFTLASDVLALLTSYGATPRGAWVTATAYALKDLVSQGGNTYMAVSAHTSGVFATDLAANRWLLVALGVAPIASAIPFTPTATLAATNVQAAIEEADTEGRALVAAEALLRAAVTTALNAHIADLANYTDVAKGPALVGWSRALDYAQNTAGRALAATPVSVTEYGTGTELGALIQAAVTAGKTAIYVPTKTNWTWTTTVTLPSLWRGRIFGDAPRGDQTTRILAATGHTKPCIDAQGAFFVELDGLHVIGTETGLGAPACFVAFARMLTGASSANHRVTRCVIEGAYYFCCLYNVGAEELVFENNYLAMYGTTNAANEKVACIVHQLSEDAFYSSIVTKEARTNGTSTSAIQHYGNEIKNQNAAGTSAIYIGPNVNDVTFDDAYGTTAVGGYYLTLGGYFDGIRLGVERVEADKTARIVWAPNDNTAGLISIYKGAYRRSGAVDATKYAVDIAGTTASGVVLHIDPSVSWTSTFAGGVEDIYLVRSLRKTTANIDFSCGGPEETLINSKVSIATLLNSSIAMGLSANLTVSSSQFGNKFWFFYDPNASKQAHDFRGGITASGMASIFTGVTGSYEALRGSVNSTANSTQTSLYNPNGQVGSISTNGSTTAYNTSSDYRLKMNAAQLPVAQCLARTLALGALLKSWNWKADGAADYGLLAHEAAQQIPRMTSGEKDAVDAKGDAVYQGVDYSKAIPDILGAIFAINEKFEQYKQAHP